jgi:hypothetical protein
MRDFGAENVEPARETAPIGAVSPKSVLPYSVMTSSSEFP